MYENGRRLNRYARMQKHKREMKNRFASSWFYGCEAPISWEEFLVWLESRRKMGDYDYDIEYWKTYYLTGPRSYAKQQTARKARRSFNQKVAHVDWDDFFIDDYEKSFDYAWTIW